MFINFVFQQHGQSTPRRLHAPLMGVCGNNGRVAAKRTARAPAHLHEVRVNPQPRHLQQPTQAPTEHTDGDGDPKG